MSRFGMRFTLLCLILVLGAACSSKKAAAPTAGPTSPPSAGTTVTQAAARTTATTGPAAATGAAARPSAPASPVPGGAATPAQQASGPVDWPVFAFDPQRSGVNPHETAITPDTVGGLKKRWSQTLPEIVGGSPILLTGVKLADGTTADLLYVTTTHGSTLALNAATGAIVWRQDTSGPQIGNQRCQVCASPAADPSRQWIYAAGNDAAVHRYAAATGEEDKTAPWPAPVSLLNGYEKRSSALNVANGYLYVALSGYFGDFGPYVGHVVAIHLPDGASHVFNVLCSDQKQLLAPTSVVPNSQASCNQREAGVWARAGVVVDQSNGPTSGSLFIASGNGRFDANNGGPNYGDSVMRLSGDASALQDYWTPASYQSLDDRDLDLGSTAPALLPQQAQSKTPWLAVQGGKDSVLRLLDRAHLGGLGGELQAINLNQGVINTAPAVWRDPAAGGAPGNDWVFVVAARATLAYRVATDASGKSSLQEAWRLSQGGSSPVLAGGVLYLTDSNGITARDPHTGKQLWSSGQQSAGGNISGNHWQTPIIANGRLYIADEAGKITCYALGQ